MRNLNISTRLVRSTSAIALAAGLMVPVAAFAQETTEAAPTNAQPEDTGGDDIVVTGIRASLERSISIKRNSDGIVDAISAEDIGKFPDTNLAESLQRITGVSINRRSGEGAEITVRGFGPQYNLVTLNGRQLAATSFQTVGGDESADFGKSTSRSFDFSNLASEGVSTLEVYKTGRAAVPSGGIGATINIKTRRPLDGKDTGFTGSIGGKATYDTSSRDCVDCGSHITPEFSGVLSWADPSDTFGVAVFGSYQKRNFAQASATVNDWNVTSYAQFLNDSAFNGTTVTNAPDADTLVGRPNDFRYHFGEGSRERINGQAVFQFRPTDTIEFTADALFAQNRQSERRSDQANWFNKNPGFNDVTFDTGHSVATPILIHEVISGATKDSGFEQQYRAQKGSLYDFGGTVKWNVTDSFTAVLDGHIGLSKSTPDNPNGASSTLVSISAPLLGEHTTYYDGGFPTQIVSFEDPAVATPGHPTIKGNGNGVLDVGDLGSQVGRQAFTNQRQRIKEIRADFDWDLGSGSKVDFGATYRTTTSRSSQTNYYQTLGDWGNAKPRDVDQIAPGVVDQFCLVCTFHKFDAQATGDGLIAFRAQDPTKLYNILSAAYTSLGNANAINGFGDDTVKEDVWGGYGQLTWRGDIAGHRASLVAGVRYENTKSTSTTLQAIPITIDWQSDNDFITRVSPDYQPLSGKGSYDNFLPSLDLQVDITDNLIARASFSKTISRPQYGDLYASVSAGVPNDATAVGGVTNGSQHNPNLKPLISDNLDASIEWYFKPDSYLSFGVFDKRVSNFIGNSVVSKNLFGLRDPSSGAPGSRSGTAREQLDANNFPVSDVSLFTYTALLQKFNGNTAAATAEFQANYDPSKQALNQAYVDTILAAYDIVPNDTDPLLISDISTPINNKDAEIYGFEAAGQYFFGDTGIGVAAAYTLVRGDVGIDILGDPTANQFALLGLSDTANATLIYDKYGISARLSYNWRDKYLADINRGGGHNPVFNKPYGQVDFNLSYDITPQIALSVEGINIFNHSVQTYARSTNQIWLDQEGYSRYLVGARYKF